MPSVIDDRYQVRRLLGRGGQGSVFLAYDPNLDIEVAVKILSSEFATEEFIERFSLEARTAAKLDHPHLVRIYDFKPSFPYIVMEYCEGGDLARQIKSRVPLSLQAALRLCSDVALGLAAAHDHHPPFLHRDLKPANVLFRKGVAKIADFGLAKAVGAPSGLTASRGMLGTIRYMSPEQCFDPSKVDQRTDLWALGVILYELLSWRRPFDAPGDSFVSIAMKLRFEPPAPLPFALPDPLPPLLARALARDPEERFSSAREFAAALAAAAVEIAGADRLFYPPEEQRAELDLAARRCAEAVAGGDVERARAETARMAALDPQDSLTRYWRASLDPRAVTRPGGAFSGPPPGSSEVSIRTLIERGAFRDARRQIGDLLRSDPGNEIAREMLSALREKERGRRDALAAAYARADEARGRGDLARVVAVWERFTRDFGEVPEAAAELAVARRERELETEAPPRTGTSGAAAAPPPAVPLPPSGRRPTLAGALRRVEEARQARSASGTLAALAARAAAIPAPARTPDLDARLGEALAALASGQATPDHAACLAADLESVERAAAERDASVVRRFREAAAAWDGLVRDAGDAPADGAALRSRGDALARAGDTAALAAACEALEAEIAALRFRVVRARAEPALAAVERLRGEGVAPDPGLVQQDIALRRALFGADPDAAAVAAAALEKAAARAARDAKRKAGAGQLPARARAFNARYHPAALAAWEAARRNLAREQEPGRRRTRAQELEAAEAALLAPPSRWFVTAAAGGPALLLAAAIAAYCAPPAAGRRPDATVTLFAAGEAPAEVTAAMRDGRPFEGLTGVLRQRTVRLPEGRYALDLRGGRHVEFDVPGVTSVVVFTPLPDFLSRLEQQAGAAGPQGAGNP